ncbi:hypothetical protein M5K25_000490 [Dendrobium thyrsiflorum]|uniref:RNase H type-1 domain-containing protein n=1 Tax=Dendrobium thyrsiflorum TaxID=117978 RepID=A0ABD0VU40_DENTH
MSFKVVKEFYYLGVKVALRRLVAADFYFLTEKALRMLGILNELDKLCRSFIWNKQDGKLGLHFVSWNNLCKPVRAGGRGLRSCASVVGPLRAKLAWKITQDKDSLLFKILGAKYGMKCGGIGFRRGSSSAGKIIYNGMKALKSVVRWKVINGCSIYILDDIWILDKSLNKWPTFVLIPELGRQNVDRLIANDQEEDYMELIHQNSGCSISSLAYKASVIESSDCFYWNCLKKANLRPRVEVFWWRIFNNAIPSFWFLYQRRIQAEFGCPRGCEAKEDLEHITANCMKLVEVICILNKWRFGFPIVGAGWEGSKVQEFIINVYCNAVYLSWRARNKLLHEGKDDSSLVIAFNAVNYASISFMDKGKLLDCWYPPPPDWIKINVDAPLLQSYKGGIEGVVRDNKGRFLLGYGHSCIHWDVAQLELMAIQFIDEIKKDWMLSYKGIIIEGDNLNVIKFLQNLGGRWRDELLSLKDQNFVFFNWINRECNKLANLCANYALFSNFCWDDLSFNNIPPMFSMLLKEKSSFEV